MKRIAGWIVFGVLGWPLSGLANSGGAPTCHVEDVPGSPMGNPVADMGYRLTAVPDHYTPGQPVTLTLSNVDPMQTVRGVLLYVEDVDAMDGNIPPMPIKRGNFLAPYPASLKAVFDGYDGCDFAGLTPVLTHLNSLPKALPLVVQWQAPAIDVGAVRVRAIALMTFGAYQILTLELRSIDDVFKDSFE